MGIEHIGDNIRRLMKIRSLTIPKLATESGMGSAAISNLLNGKAEPRSSTLIKLANALNVRFEALLTETPQLESLRFRTAKTMSGREKAERDQIRVYTATWLSDYCYLEKELGQILPYVLGDIPDDNPLVAAKAVRTRLGVSPEQPIHDITELVESAGIKLNIRPFGFKKTFGFSIGRIDGGPAIVVNSESGISIERQLFTIAHELGHLILHKNSYKAIEDIEDEQEEKEADLFAGHLLVPDEAFQKEWAGSKGLPFVDRVLRVKKIFKVSYMTILNRLFQLEYSRSYKDMLIRFRMEYKAKYGHDLKGHFEPSDTSEMESLPVAPEDPQNLDVSDLMEERYARLVREAYEQGLISIGRAGEMLNLSLYQMRTLIKAWQVPA